jgi:hypothetical protein
MSASRQPESVHQKGKMCLPPLCPPPPLLPGAQTSHSPTPTSAPGPAATILPSPTSGSPSPSLSPTSLPAGRSKAQRWGDDGGNHDGRLPSYKDVLVSSSSTPLATHPVAGDDWVTVVDRRARWRRPRPLVPLHRPVPADLRGKCFNCFSPSHRAVVCRRPVRCFVCRLLGHRAHVCPRRQTTPPRPRRSRVWRPVSLLPPMGPPDCAAGDHSGGSGAGPGGGIGSGSSGGGHRRTRRGHRRRRNSSAAGTDGRGGPSGELPQPPPEDVRAISGTPSPPRRFIKRTRKIAQAEDDLRRALLISVVGLRCSGRTAEVSDALSLKFDLEDDALDLRLVVPNTFIALLPNMELADRMLSEGQSFYAPPLRVHIRRWSRQFLASGGREMPFLLDIELRGLPFHLRDVHSAEQLLVGHCLVHELLLGPEEVVDLSSFRLRVWCDDPDNLPSSLDLHVEEPPVDVGPSYARTVTYPRTEQFPPPPPPPSPPTSDRQDEDRSSNSGNQQRRRLNSQPSAGRPSVLARLGPRVQVNPLVLRFSHVCRAPVLMRRLARLLLHQIWWGMRLQSLQIQH